MEGISKKELRSKENKVIAVDELIAECQELQEPWMMLDEFLKSGFEGWCWIVEITREPATLSYFDSDGVFSGTSEIGRAHV